MSFGLVKLSIASWAREKVECDGGRMLLTSAQASASGVMAFRGGFAPGQALPKPHYTIYGASPLFALSKPGTLYIQRLDKTSGGMEMELGDKDLVGGRFYDFARVGKQLEPGGLSSVTGSSPPAA